MKIIETARILFNRHGFDSVTIEMIMSASGLTHGGFYNHFKNKEALHSEAISSFLMGRGLKWRTEAGIDSRSPDPEMARQMVNSYLSTKHLGDLDGQCPMIALSSDIARASNTVQSSYQELLEAMVWLFETSIKSSPNSEANPTEIRSKALSLAALCVGGMILARTLPNSKLAEEVRAASHLSAMEITSNC
ncbi:MAG: TetR/AcrR family transcriptional regulator [Robiginitomaculum sp.]|nr:TetR/AcrR family transcriptional regulator [Robiginitomaculum sp.]